MDISSFLKISVAIFHSSIIVFCFRCDGVVKKRIGYTTNFWIDFINCLGAKLMEDLIGPTWVFLEPFCSTVYNLPFFLIVSDIPR